MPPELNTQALRRDIRSRPVTWAWVGLAVGVLALLGAFAAGDLLDPMTPQARHGDFDRALETCVDVYSEIEPDGIFREDIGRHYDPEGICFLVVAYSGQMQFVHDWSDPEYVELVRTVRGE